MRRSTRRFLGNTFLIIFSLPILSALFESETQKKLNNKNDESK